MWSTVDCASIDSPDTPPKVPLFWFRGGWSAEGAQRERYKMMASRRFHLFSGN